MEGTETSQALSLKGLVFLPKEFGFSLAGQHVSTVSEHKNHLGNLLKVGIPRPSL